MVLLFNYIFKKEDLQDLYELLGVFAMHLKFKENTVKYKLFKYLYDTIFAELIKLDKDAIKRELEIKEFFRSPVSERLFEDVAVKTNTIVSNFFGNKHN